MLKSTCLVCIAFIFATYGHEAHAQLPIPTGPFCIGKTKVQLTDSKRLEYFTEAPDDFRFLVVDIWYPGDCTGERVPYIHPEVLKAYRREEQESDSLNLSFFQSIDTHAHSNSAWATSVQSVPVLIFSPGAGTPLAFYTSLFEHLASYGYVVFGMLHTYDENVVESPDGNLFYRKQAFFDSQFDEAFNEQFSGLLDFVKSEAKPGEKRVRVKQLFKEDFPTTFNVKRRAHDIAFIAEKVNELNNDPNHLLYQKMDVEKIGGFGHSFGGAAMGQVLFMDTGIKAAINLDGWQFGDRVGEAFSKPFLYVWGDYEQPDALNKVVYQNAGDFFTDVKMLGTSHSNFSDLPLMPGASIFSNLGPIEGVRNAQLMNALVKGYFDAHLKGMVKGWETLQTEYAELVFDMY